MYIIIIENCVFLYETNIYIYKIKIKKVNNS